MPNIHYNNTGLVIMSALMDLPFGLNKLGMVHCIYRGSHEEEANSADPDEIPHDAAFHLGPHCLPK